jgi:hypothetical protein
LQRFRRGPGDFILYRKDVVDLPIVCLRPKLKTIVRFGQFRGYTYMVALAAHSSLKNISDAQLSAHLA